MGWDQSRFFPAFKRAGMLTSCQVLTGLHAGTTLDGNFDTPDVVESAIDATVPDYRFEFETGSAAMLAAGDQVTINDKLMRVVGSPRREGDGYYSVADLALMSAHDR